MLLGRLVKLEEAHKPPVPLQRSASAGFADAAPLAQPRSGESLYPCLLTDDTDQALGQLARDLVKAWGDRALTVIELEERIATAAEKAPTEDPHIQALRGAIARVKGEYDAVVKHEEARVREAGGLHVIGTERHESRRVDNQRVQGWPPGDPGSTRFSRWETTCYGIRGDRVAGLMNAFRVEEDMPIESGMLTRSLEGARRRWRLITTTSASRCSSTTRR